MRFTVLTALILTLQSCSDITNKEHGSDQPPSEIPTKYNEEEKSSIREGMKKAISDFSNENEVRDLDDAKFQLQRLGIAWHQCCGQLITAKADSSILKMRDSAASVLSAYQKVMFPRYRKAFADETDKKLWIEDCSAFISGDNNDVLNLIGVAFAPNRRKQESYETLRTVLRQYRFKKITFRVFKRSSDITFYAITSSADTDYIPMTE